MALNITNENYEALLAESKPLVIDFWAEFCAPCRAIAPIVEVQSALLSSIDAFNVQLMDHFQEMKEKGREISIRVNTISGWEDGLETEVNGEELSEIIEGWITSNCVAGRNHQKLATETSMYYDSARIPLFNEEGKAVQARQWIRGLRKYLKDIGISSKVKTRGLGQAQLIIGE